MTDKKRPLKDLVKDLKTMREYHLSIGSELYTRDMEEKERKLMDEIRKLRPRTTDKTILRSTTNDGNLAKFYLELVEADGTENIVVITKLILTENGYYPEYQRLKSTKDKVLIQQRFAFKIGTLSKIMNWVNNGVL